MALANKIDEDLKTAMKTRNTLALATLRMLKAAVNYYLIEKKKETIDDTELFQLIQKQVKQRIDSMEGFKKGGRADLAEKESKEKAILEAYLPSPLTDSELRSLVQSVIQSLGVTSKNDLGKVMKEVLVRSGGRADGRRANQTALSLLSGNLEA